MKHFANIVNINYTGKKNHLTCLTGFLICLCIMKSFLILKLDEVTLKKYIETNIKLYWWQNRPLVRRSKHSVNQHILSVNSRTWGRTWAGTWDRTWGWTWGRTGGLTGGRTWGRIWGLKLNKLNRRCYGWRLLRVTMKNICFTLF